jgi:GcrA cell cycle regulator
MSWNNERVSTLVNLWTAGRSASEIATTLGGATRNAVIGKVHRLELAKRIAHGRAARDPRSFKARARTYTLRKPPPTTTIPDLSPAPAFHPTIRELTGHHCRWPEGDPKKPGFHFCGRTPLPGKPYCPHHHGHAHQVGTRRGRKPAQLHDDREGAQAAH